MTDPWLLPCVEVSRETLQQAHDGLRKWELNYFWLHRIGVVGREGAPPWAPRRPGRFGPDLKHT